MTLDLDALRAVAEAATPGPWTTHGANVTGGGYAVANCFGNRDDDRYNLAHIATFDPPTVIALIDRAERAA